MILDEFGEDRIYKKDLIRKLSLNPIVIGM